MFQLSKVEFENLKSQIVTSNWGGLRRAAPYAFTEQGVAMLSSVLNSRRAVQVNIEIMRAFGMNLMEGAIRLGSREYRQFVGIARGSAGEVCYQLLLAKDLKYISNETYQELRSGYDRVIQMLSRLSQSLDR